MPEDETLTPEGTETEIITPEAPAPQEDPEKAALQAEVEALRAEKEAADRKFAESAREAQILAAQKKQLEERQNINQPTEDDLRRNIPGYDSMVPNEQFIAGQNYRLEQKLTAIEAKDQQRETEASWNRDVESFAIADPKLQGREDEFKKFANMKTHRGAPLDVLKKAFLFDTPETKPVARVPGLEPGSGGTREPAAKPYTAEQVMNLRKNNPKEFHRLLNSGKLKLEDIQE